MTVKLIFGGLAEVEAEVVLTFRPGGRELGLDVSLTPEARAVITSILAVDGQRHLAGPSLSSIRACPAPWCILWTFADLSPPPPKLKPGIYSYKAPLADPLGPIIATALAYWAENNGVNAVVEVYSNAWHRYCAALDALRGLKTRVLIYTSYYDSRYACYDEVDIKYVTANADRLQQPATFINTVAFAAPRVVEPKIERDILKLLKGIWDGGGLLTLNAAKKWHNIETINDALSMGLLSYSKSDSTLRITEGGIAILRMLNEE